MHKRIGANRLRKHSEKRLRVGKAVKKALVKGVSGSKIMVIAVCVIGGAFFGAVRLAAWIKNSPLFTVSVIAVEGTARIDKNEVVRLSGIKTGMRIMDIRPAFAARAIAKNLWVKHARVTRRFPNRVIINVQERTPVALLSAGNVYYTDEDGNLMPLFAGTYSNLPLITGVKGVRIDSAVCVEAGSFERAKRFLNECKAIDAAFAKRVSQIDFGSDAVIRLSLEDMPVVIEMNDADTKKSMARLKKIVESVEDKTGGGLKRINLCYENLAYVRQ
jgi:cell division septal protein FtsQ